MSGDQGYRAVLADCERALGRADVALRLVAEALAAHPDAEETLELRIVEAGARRDLGENAAARLVLESALGGRPDPEALDAGDPGRLRLAAAYADLLEAQGEHERAEGWRSAIVAVDPDNVSGAVEGPGIEFIDLEEELEVLPDDSTPPEVVEELPEDDHGLGKSFDEEVEAEVAELLGESDPADGEH